VNLDQLKAAILGDWNDPTNNANTTALTLIGSRLLDEFRHLIERAQNVPGDIVEAGVWRGGACIWAAGVLEALGSDKRVYVCDSFAGLPPPSSPKETLDFSRLEALRVPLEQVEANFDRFGLKRRAVFVKGWFKDTMPTLDIAVSVLRLDGDMYESTDEVLRHMYDRVSPGGFVIVDDYQFPPCRMAVDELRSREKHPGSLEDRAGVWWQKPV